MVARSLFLLLYVALPVPVFAARVNSNPSCEYGVALVNKSGSAGTFTTINAAIQSGASVIFVCNGIYNENLSITTSGIEIIGQSENGVVIQGTNTSKDVVDVYANSVLFDNLTIDAQTYNAQAAFVVGNGSNDDLVDCKILGSTNTFAIYYAGNNYASSSSLLNAIENPTTSNMGNNNAVIGSSIFSTIKGDGVSFSAQNHGTFEYNTIAGTRLAVYLCDNSTVSHNSINNSVSQGMYVSTPASNDVISHNAITNSNASGITIRTQVDHPMSSNYRSGNLIISKNTIIDTHYMGIELQSVGSATINDNFIDSVDYSGIYAVESSNLYMLNNTIDNTGLATVRSPVSSWDTNTDSDIFLDVGVSNSLISGNVLNNSLDTTKYAVAITSGDTNNVIKTNSTGSSWLSGQSYNTTY